MQDTITSPYAPITGQGLGISYSSLNKVGTIFPQKGFGSAGLLFYPNMSNGNLVFKDRILKISEESFPLELGFIYNSQITDPAKVWQFSLKRFNQLPAAQPSGGTGILQEEDGHLTTYLQDSKNPENIFYAQESVNSTKFLHFDSTKNLWLLQDPKSGDKEYYDSQGLLSKKINSRGKETNYEYDNNQQLTAIIGPTGNRYEIRRQGGNVGLYDANYETLLQSWVFDSSNRLRLSQTPDGYSTSYTYSDSDLEKNSAKLKTVTQSDNSVLSFGFDNQNKIEAVQLGGEQSANKIFITYADSTHANQAWITDGFNIKTTVKYNQENNLTEITKQLGYSQAAPQIDVTSYTYNTKGQLENIIFPDNGIAHKEYEPVTGLLIKQVKPNGQTIAYTYQPRGERFNLITKIAYLDSNTSIVTRYVYDDNFDKNGNRFLRFKISPEGKVTEYRPDARGNVFTEREYLANLYDLSKFPPNGAPNLSGMLEWVSHQDPQIISLKTYLYDGNGQITNIMQFPNIDKNGNGVQDSTTGIEFIFSNMFGCVTQRKVYQDSNWSITNQRFDDLQRITEKRDALNNKTSYEYQDATSQVKITYPNGSSRITKNNDSGLLVSEQASANSIDGLSQTRITGFQRDNAGRIVLTTRPDGNQIYSFYDKQNRLGFTVSALGIVTEYRYDRQNLYNTEIKYYTPIDPTKLKTLPTAENLINLLKQTADSKLDRYNYIFLDASGRKAYEVDGNNILTQYFFDNLDRETARIIYKERLTDDQLKKLQSKQEINLIPDFNKDRCARIFYNKDNDIIGRQDSAGYITQYKIGINGKVGEKILYDKKMPIDLSIKDFNQLIPAPNVQKDAHTYYYYNARKQLVSKINPKKYFFQYTYLRNGLKNQVTQFATEVNTISPIPPIATPEDQVTIYHYDLLNHQIQTDLPYGANHLKQYDKMENCLFDQIKDTQSPDNLDADHQRNTQTQYDGWNQKAREANPFVGSLLVNTNNPDDKEKIWKTKSTRHNFDNTGLKLSTTDSLGNITYFYYDADRRPLIAISPRGRITETTLNSFGEEINIRRYNNPIATTGLTGGFLTADLRAKLNQLQEPLKDEVTAKTTDKRGQITQIIDPEGYTTVISYNAFKQKETENLPVSDKTPSLIIQHEYETRGLEITTTKTANNQSISIHRDYQNIYGKETLFVDEQGAQYQTEYDFNGQVSKKTDPNNTVTTQKTWNSFGQILTETNSQNATTTYAYQQHDRSYVITYPENKTTIKKHFNIFQEKISETDALNNTKSVQHASDGKVAVTTDALLNTTSNQFNLLGNITLITDPNKVQTSIKYNPDNQVESEIKDAQNLKLTTAYTRDMFGNAISIQDPRKNNTQQVFDRRNLLTQKTEDPNNLGLVTTKTYNAQKTVLTLARGDIKNNSQYQETYGFDQFNRSTGKTIDPDGLKIQTNQHLSLSGKVIAEIDANQNITRKFYDNLDRLRITVDAEGGVKEKIYNTENQIITEKHYEQKIDSNKLNDNSTLQEVMAMIKPDPQDGLITYFYDDNGNKRFEVNSLGVVGERRYDLADREIRTLKYATSIDPKIIPTLTTAQLIDLMKSKVSSQDRVRIKILDQKNQVRFQMLLTDDNKKAIITEKRYDNVGNVITEIGYAVKVTDPEKIAQLPPEKVLENLSLDPVNDRAKYFIFDSLNRVNYTVDGEGGVIKFDHDENNNLIQTCEFKDPIVVPKTYPELTALLKTLKPDFNKDSITQKKFDAANRVVEITDPLLFKDIFEKDDLGNSVKHTDRNGSVWRYQYDKANRLLLEITPPIPLSEVNLVNHLQDLSIGLTVFSPKDQSNVERETVYDQNGNKKKISEAKNIDNKGRNLIFEYDKNNQLVKTLAENVPVDDPAKPANFQTPPIKLANITTETVFNAKKLKVVEKNENDQWTFYIYDSEMRKAYEVAWNKAVVKYDYNAFGEVVSETKLYNPVNLDITQFVQAGIPKNILEANIVFDKKNDRTTLYNRDSRGNALSIQKNQVFYYQPTQVGPSFGVSNPISIFVYNAFGEKAFYSQLLNPAKDLWNGEYKWYNRNGQVIAECDGIQRVKISTYNTFKKCIERSEWANIPTKAPTLQTSFQALLSTHSSSDKDRKYQYDYNLNKQLVAEIKVNIIVQKIVLDPISNVPQLVDLPAQNLKRSYAYSPVGKKVLTQYENASTEYMYYDSCGYPIAKADVARQSQDAHGNPITLVPLTYYGNNAFGQKVSETRFKLGSNSPSVNELPKPLGLDPDDQTELTKVDNRGLPLFKQDANKNVQGYTFTADPKKIARQWNALSHLKPQNIKVVHIDEKRFVYDGVENPTEVNSFRDNAFIQSQKTQYNIFSEPSAEGDQNSWSLFRFYDNCGRVWKTNADKGVWSIHLHDLVNNETVQFKSPTMSLQNLAYDDVPSQFSLSFTDSEKTETQRDVMGRMTKKISPAYAAENAADPLNIRLNMYISQDHPEFGKVSISWPHPTASVGPLITNFYIAPYTKPDNLIQLPFVESNNFFGVDVSGLATDRYFCKVIFTLAPHIFARPDSFVSTNFIQIDTDNIQESTALVVVVENDNVLRLKGSTQNISKIILLDDEKNPIGKFPIQSDSKGLYVDLSQQLSGTYTVKPEFSDYSVGSESESFNIYTPIPASKPIAKEIDLSVSLLSLASHAQLKWKVSSAYVNNRIKIRCRYTASDNSSKTIESIITPGQVIKEYKDSQNNTLYCNCEFGADVAQINTLSLWICLDNDNTVLLPLLSNVSPVQLKKPADKNIITTTNFDSKNIVYISPFDLSTQPTEISYLDTSQQFLSSWLSLPIEGYVNAGLIINVPAGFVVDVTGLDPGVYPFYCQNIESQFSVSPNGLIYSGEDSIQSKRVYQGNRKYVMDNWNNLIEYADSFGNTTYYNYNIFDKVSRVTEPLVEVVHEDGNAEMANPVTVYGFNERGSQIGSIDANTHTEGSILNSAGQKIKSVLANGVTSEEYVIDALNRSLYRFDPRGKQWKMSYDHNNNLLIAQTPSSQINVFQYDEKNHRISSALPEGQTYFYNFDPFSNIEASYLPVGQMTQMKYDANHLLIQKTDADNNVLYFTRDAFGNLTQKIDIGGAVYTYSYNFKMQLISERSSGGNHGSMLLIAHASSATVIAVPGQDIDYTYAGDNLVEINDNVQMHSQLITYDPEGRRVAVILNQESEGYDEARIACKYDAMGRKSGYYLNPLVVNYHFDFVGNCRHNYCYVYLYDSSHQPFPWVVPQDDRWYTYDETDAVLIYNGILNQQNKIVIQSKKGLALTYQNTFRSTETIIDDRSKTITKTLIYNDDGLLTDTVSSSGDATHREYASANWLKKYTETVNGSTSIHEVNCNDNQWQIFDQQTSNDVVQASTTFGGFTNTGLYTTQTTTYPGGVRDDLQIDYVDFDQKQIAKIGGTRTVPGLGPGPYGSSLVFYDPNGVINSSLRQQSDNLVAVDSYVGGYQSPLFNEGIGYANINLSSLPPYFPFVDQPPSDTGDTEYYYDVDGKLAVTQYIDFNAFDMKNEFTIVDGITQVSSSFPPPIPGTYVVSAGDTFDLIAQKIYGDSAFGVNIAEANYTSLSATLAAGTILQLPQIIPMHNKFNTAKPYDQFISAIIGNIYPVLQAKQPPPIHKKHGGFWGGFIGEIIECIVVVAAVIVGNAEGLVIAEAVLGSSAVAGSLGVLTIEGITTGVMAGLASAAEQGLAVSVGLQEHFSLRYAIEIAIQSGAGVAMGAGIGSVATKTFEEGLEQIAKNILIYGRVAVAEQLMEMAAGVRKQFDLKAIISIVAGQVIASPINEELAANFGTPQTLTEEGELLFEKGMTSGVAISLVSREVEHTPVDFVGVVAQSLGSSLGQTFAASMPLPTAPTPMNNNQSSSASSKNPGGNRFAMFGNSGNSNPTGPSNNSDLIWTTDSNGNPIQVEQRNPFPRLDQKSGLDNLLAQNPNIIVAGSGVSGEVLYDRTSGEYFAYDNYHGIQPMEKGVEPLYPEKYVAEILGGYGLFKVAINLVSNYAVNQLVNPIEKLANYLGDIEGSSLSSGQDYAGKTLYRVWGGSAKAYGRSWTDIDPLSVENFRNVAGLPNVNEGNFISEGILLDATGVTIRVALPLDGNIGGLTELLVPQSNEQIELTSVSGINLNI